jgi:hypothetical protein
MTPVPKPLWSAEHQERAAAAAPQPYSATVVGPI